MGDEIKRKRLPPVRRFEVIDFGIERFEAEALRSYLADHFDTLGFEAALSKPNDPNKYKVFCRYREGEAQPSHEEVRRAAMTYRQGWKDGQDV